MPLKNFEDLSDEILDMQSRESERYALLYERLANQNDMTNEEQEALASEVKYEVETLEKPLQSLKRCRDGPPIRQTSLKPALTKAKKVKVSGVFCGERPPIR